ncbi:YheC/YheD family protein [Lutispora thermophila]|uniref:YheC/D like ATP-grasp n=1 Tax=Lutispora thermophila DSM 19022 TaxID=1122184 RepID=A0A1M6CGT4_9FIRM|nr:YheC/YheD family protein [Lutispora thermophila]SHI59964.1 YheC/D like ATP-grasp [Lutispora thermophila DSM 19022]
MKKYLVGLLCNNLAPINYYNLAEDLSIELIKFTRSGIDWEKQEIKGIMFNSGKWEEKVTRFPDSIYNRCYTSSTVTTDKLEKVIGSGKVFNSFTRFDKYKVYSILKESGLEDLMLPTYQYTREHLLSMLHEEGTVLMKPVKGAMGHKILRFTFQSNEYKVYIQTFYSVKIIKSADDLIIFIDKQCTPEKYIIQPFISFASIDGHVFDMRMLVQKNKKGVWNITADMSRVAYRNFFITNLTYDVLRIHEVFENAGFDKTILLELRDISIRVAEILEEKLCFLGEISVDFGIESNGKLRIIEVNGKPEKTVFGRISDEALQKVFITPLEYAAYLAEN